MIKVSEIVLHEADEPYFVRDLLYADLLAGEDCAQVDFPSLVTDAAATGDSGGEVMQRIVELAQSLVGSGRFCVQVSGHLESNGLVGPFVVEVIDKGVETSLLLQEVL